MAVLAFEPWPRLFMGEGVNSADEPEAEYRHFGAALRVRGAADLHDEISQRLGVEPTECHRIGEMSPSGRSWTNDIWLIESPLPDEAALGEHILWLGRLAIPHASYLAELQSEGARVDIFCGYRSNMKAAGFEVSVEALDVLVRLQQPLGVSVIVW